jgi:sirohydrochlorin ferrochelatase
VAAAGAASRVAARTCLTTYAAFLDDDPSVDVVVARLPRDDAVIVVPFLVGGGGHADVDIPARVLAAAGTAAAGRERITVLEPLGRLPELYDAITRGVRRALTLRRCRARGTAAVPALLSGRPAGIASRCAR